MKGKMTIETLYYIGLAFQRADAPYAGVLLWMGHLISWFVFIFGVILYGW